jgi:hypothetical protein
VSARLFLLLVVPAYVILYAAVAPWIKRRTGLVGLVVVAYLLWALSGRVLDFMHTAPPGEPQGLGNLGLVADIVGAVALVIICVQVQRRPDGRVFAGDATRALLIGAALVSTILLVALILFSQMAR